MRVMTLGATFCCMEERASAAADSAARFTSGAGFHDGWGAGTAE